MKRTRTPWLSNWMCALLVAVLIFAAAPAPTRATTSTSPAAGLSHAFSDTEGTSTDFDLLGALRLLRGDEGLGGPVRPRDAVTRAEFTAIVLRVGGLAESASQFAGQPPPFADAGSIPVWAWGYVGAARHHGLIQGYEDGTFRPGASVRLAEALAMLLRLLGRQGESHGHLGWPEAYLELGERVGLSGVYSGYGNVQLDRAGLSHLAAQALLTPANAGGHQARTLLETRYGAARGVLASVSPDGRSVNVDGAGLALADPYLWQDKPPTELTGQLVDLLRLPGGELAYICPAGAAHWSPDKDPAYLSGQPAARLAGLPSWWRDYLAAEALMAQGHRTQGSLRSGRVSLVLPASSGGEAFGFVRLKGSTTAERLLVRYAGEEHALEVTVAPGGAFDERVYLPPARGEHQVEIWTPVPGRDGWAYYELSFTVDNRLTLRHDHLSGATLLWPRTRVAESFGYVDILLAGVPGGQAYLRVERAGEYQLLRVPVTAGMVASRVWLTQGPGEYDLRLCLPLDDDGFYALTDVRFTAVNTAQTVTVWLAPGSYVLSGHPDVRATALGVAGDRSEAYAQAREIYRWLGRNIAYDTARAAAGDAARPLDTLQILARGQGVCEDYANLFAALCRALGIPARIIAGIAPASGGVPHAWNEFWSGDRWVELDATWGAGYVRDGSFVRQPTDEWFDRDLTATHLRSDIHSDWRAVDSK